MIVYEMQRNGAKVADVVTLNSGKCVVAWPTSVIVYDSEEAARAVHIDHMGARGEHTSFEFEWGSHPNIQRGMMDCLQDSCENAPFSSVGGLLARETGLMPPPYITEGLEEYVLGYAVGARSLYGADWRTCSFGWTPAMTIGGEGHRCSGECPECRNEEAARRDERKANDQ